MVMSTQHNGNPWNTMAMPTEHNGDATENNGDAHGTQWRCPWNTMVMSTEHNADAHGTHRQCPTALDS